MRHASEYEEYDGLLYNGLEETVFELFPSVKSAKESLLDAGADFALMSGSGATVFGIFRDDKSAAVAKKKIENNQPDWGGVYPAHLV